MAENKDRIRLLIIDDEPSSQDVLLRLLSNPERELVTAQNGLEAKEILEHERFDLVLTDLNMPCMDGMELLRFVKARYPEIIVIIITGYASIESALKAIDQGAYDYITKPFKLAEMDIMVKNACEKILLLKERDAVLKQIDDFTRRVNSMQNRIQQLEEREQSLFLGNFDPHHYGPQAPVPPGERHGDGVVSYRELLISQLKRMKKKGNVSGF
ncbi:MAG: response regulator [bacterium]